MLIAVKKLRKKLFAAKGNKNKYDPYFLLKLPEKGFF